MNTTVINNDGIGHTVALIRQCELRHLSNGLYRVAATVSFVTDDVHHIANPFSMTTSLITGTLNLGSTVPQWTPNQDVAAFNQDEPTPDEYQLSISQDGLSAVWDSNVQRTYFPSTGPPQGPAHTFCCHRLSTTVPFSVDDIRAINGVYSAAGFVDPHIGEDHLPNGVVELFHNDFVAGICRGTLDTVTGNLGPTTVVSVHMGVGFDHSSFVHRDSTGKARAVNWSRYPGTGGSSAFYSEGIDDDGTPELVIDGAVPVSRWYNNPGLVGGSWHYCSDGQTEPQLREVTMIANTSIVGGSGLIPAWAPARPVPGSGVFISVVAIGINVGTVPLPPYAMPPVINDIFVLPLVILDPRLHDIFTGLAEWSFISLPLYNQTYDMQLLTWDVVGNQIIASNTATFSL